MFERIYNITLINVLRIVSEASKKISLFIREDIDMDCNGMKSQYIEQH